MILAYRAYKKRQARRQAALEQTAGAPSQQIPQSELQQTAQAGVQGPVQLGPQQNLEPGSQTAPLANIPKCQHGAQGLDPTGQYPGRCTVCHAEKHRMRVYRWKLIIGLLAPYLLASLDLTVVATALPFIASHFNKFNQLNWIVTAYTLTSTAFIPMFGQLADVFGRHSVLQLSMGLQVVGSTLAAAAQTWPMLLLGRALQGMSAAGIMNLIQIVLSDKVSLKDNAKNNTIFQFTGGISYSIGPIVGGYLTNSNWRYCFVISIPIAVAAHFLIYFLLRKELVRGTYITESGRRGSFWSALLAIDFGGTLLFLFGVGLIIVATAWGGSTYSWKSAAVLVPLIIGAVLFFLFWAYEYLLEPGHILAVKFPRQVAMLPWVLFEKRDVILMAIVEFATGSALYSVFYFIGIYFTLVEGYEASHAGVQLLYYIPGIGVGVYTAMFMCNVFPKQTFLPIVLGTLIETVGIAMITWAVTQRRISVVNGMMGLAGAGTGLRFMPITLHTAGIWPTRIASSMSIMRFSLPFGGTLALTIMGSVFNNKMANVFANPQVSNAVGGINLHNQQSLDAIKQLPAAAQAMVRNEAKRAVKWAFVSILPILGIALLASLFMGNVWIGGSKKKGEAEKEADLRSSEVIYKPYLLALLKRDVDRHKKVSVPQTMEDKEDQARQRQVEKARETEEIADV